MNDDPVLTPHEVADELRVNYETLLDYLHDGRLRGVKRGRRWFIRRSAVDEFLTPGASAQAAS
jgi:excisionase family DNA binding protein